MGRPADSSGIAGRAVNLIRKKSGNQDQRSETRVWFPIFYLELRVLLRNTRKTGAVSSAPPEESAMAGGVHPRPLRYFEVVVSAVLLLFFDFL